MASKAGRLQIQLEMQVAQLQRDLDRANRLIDDSASSWKKSFTSVFTGNFANDFVQKLGAAISQTITDLGDIADKSLALGDTAENFQRIAFAAEQAGVSMDSVVSASNKLQKSLGEGTEQTAEALDKLGLSLEQVRKLSPTEALITVAGRLGEVKSASVQAALAADTMGKGFAALKPMVAQGEDALRSVTQQARVASDEAVKAADDYGDAVAEMQGAVKIFLAEALEPMLPLLTQSAKEFTNVGNNASGAADGVDRATSSARQLGETLASTFQSLTAFRDLLNALQTGSAAAIKGNFKWPWEDDTPDSQTPQQKIDAIANAWSRMTTHFNDVQGSVSTTYDLAKATRDVEDATDKAEKSTKKATKARKDDNDEKKRAVELDRLLADVQSRMDEQWSRTESLLIDKEMAQAELNGANREELEILALQLQGYSEKDIAIARQTQGIRAAAEEQARAAQEAADQAAAFQDTIVNGFTDIFYSMTQGSEDAKDAVARLVTELAALYLQMLALNTLKQFNGNGTWGFQGVAKGGVFDQHGMMPFAQGGIVRSATAFTFGGGRLGVMGEAGPEAIMPLGRDSAGRLGVRGGGVTVNVHNNAGAQISVDQRGQEIAIIVDQVRGVIANDFARGGNVVSSALEGAYGVRR